GRVAARLGPAVVAIGRGKDDGRVLQRRIGLQRLVERHDGDALALQRGFARRGVEQAADLVDRAAAADERYGGERRGDTELTRHHGWGWPSLGCNGVGARSGSGTAPKVRPAPVAMKVAIACARSRRPCELALSSAGAWNS